MQNIVSVETILSAYTHTNTQAPAYSSILTMQSGVVLVSTKRYYRLRRAKNNARDYFNPFTAQASTIFGQKSVHINTCKHTIFRLYHVSTFTTVHFGANPFTC